MDERKKFTDEQADESRAERELFAMTCLMNDPRPLAELAKVNDWDDLGREAAQILNDALTAEADGEQGDYIRAKEAAGIFIDEAIAEFTPLDEFAEQEIADALGIETENTGGGVMCFVFYNKKRGTSLTFGWANGGLGFYHGTDDGEELGAGELSSGSGVDAQVRFIKETCAKLDYACPERPCECGHSELDHVGAASAGGRCWNGSGSGNSCACLDYLPEDREKPAPVKLAAHTAGPWHDMGESSFADGCNEVGSDRPVAHVEMWDGMDEDEQAEARANLRLIAAAPDLLELARAIVLEAGLIEAAHNQPKHPRAWQNSGERWANLARAAILRATEGK